MGNKPSPTRQEDTQNTLEQPNTDAHTGSRFIPDTRMKLNLLQSLSAALFIFITFRLALFIDDALLVTSLGASAFIAFVFPRAESARPRFLIGGYCSACFWGILFSFARQRMFIATETGITLCSLAAVFLVIFTMSIMDFEHPPSVALCITLVVSDTPLGMAAVAVASILLLSVCRVWFVKLLDKLNL